MILLLPPSETKKSGGIEASETWLELLAFEQLLSIRKRAIEALAKLSAMPDAARKLKVPARNLNNLVDNQLLVQKPLLLPAIDRFDGVLFDALHDRGLKGSATEFNQLDLSKLGPNEVYLQTAIFGLIDLFDEIPNFRFTAGTGLPGFSPLDWSAGHDPIWRGLAAAGHDLIVDGRSNSYAKLAPVSQDVERLFLNVVSEDPSGVRRALNHFNKKAKGQFARAWLLYPEKIAARHQLIEIANLAGLKAELTPGVLTLIA